jgi:hypothetical protein
MKEAFGEYERVAGGSPGMSSLWLGGDHLLYIRGSGFILPFSEEYKRFRYADIQGIVLARTAGLFWGALGYFAGFAVAAGIAFGLLFLREPGDVGLLLTTLALPLPGAVAMLALLIRHLVLGPRCVCEIQTGVKRERLAPVSRLIQGREVLERLSPRIRQAQAGLEVSAELQAPMLPAPALRVPGVALVAFVLLALVGVSFLMLYVLPPSDLMATTALLLVPIAGALLLASLAACARVPCPGSVRNAGWASLAALLALVSVAAVFYADQAIIDPALTLDFAGPMEAFAEISGRGGIGFSVVTLAAAVALLIASAIGLVVSLRWRVRLGTNHS